MQQQSVNPELPLWLLIVLVGTIVGVSMGRAQSMGLYLPPVTKALDVGREPFGAKAGCPVSKLVNAKITLDATLVD